MVVVDQIVQEFTQKSVVIVNGLTKECLSNEENLYSLLNILLISYYFLWYNPILKYHILIMFQTSKSILLLTVSESIWFSAIMRNRLSLFISRYYPCKSFSNFEFTLSHKHYENIEVEYYL